MPTKFALKRLGRSETSKDALIERHIPYTRLIDHETVQTKDGAIMQIIALEGWPFETTDDATLDSLKNLRDLMFRGVGDKETAIYSHIIRRKTNVIHEADYDSEFSQKLNESYNNIIKDREVYENALYLTIIVRPSLLKKSQGFLKKKPKTEEEQNHTEINIRLKLKNKVTSLIKNLSVYNPRILTTREGATVLGFSEPLEFLYELVNGDQAPITPPRMGIDKFIGAKRLIFGNESFHVRGASEKDERFGAIISIKEYQPETAAGSLDHLMELPRELVITQSFIFNSRQKSIDRLESVERSLRVAEDSVTLQQQLADAREGVQVGTVATGQHHLTVCVTTRRANELDDAVTDVTDAFVQVGAQAVREDLNCEPAYWSQLPGNFAYIGRDAGLTTANVAGLMSLHNYPYGKAHGNAWGPCVTIFETLSGTPYHFNFHVGSLGNFTMTGPSGSGKTVLLGFLFHQAQKFQPRCFFMDKDRGAELTIRAAGGAYAVINAGVNTGFNPLQLEDTEENRAFIVTILKSLVGRDITPKEETLLSKAIDASYKQPMQGRRLRNLVELFEGAERDNDMAERLKKWHGNGKYAWLFDNERDLLPIDQRIIGFDLTSILDQPEIRTPVLLYMFHRIQQALDGTKTLIFIDEGWKALSDKSFESMIRDWLKTIRKMNGVIGLGTQEVADILKSPIADTLIEQCPTQIFLPNHKAKSDQYREAFQLTEGEFSIIKKSPPGARHFLIKQGNASAVAKLDLSGMEDEIAILSGNAQTIRLADKIREKHGDDPSDWLPIFNKERRSL